MKKAAVLSCALALSLSLTACGGGRPSDDKIKAALDEGTLTVEDALSKGWIDQNWIDENFDQVEAQSKIYLFTPFETTYLDGTPASSDLISGTMCLVFFNTAGEETMEKLTAFQEAQAGMAEAGVPLLGIVTDSDLDAAREKLADVSFPIIVYNDEMRAAMGHEEMIDTDLTAVFTRKGGFYTAWYTTADAEGLVETAQSLVSIDD